MLELAWQSVLRLPRRFVVSAGAVAGSVTLVLVAGALYLGLLDAVVRWPGSLPGDLVVSEGGGSSAMLHASSAIEPSAAAAVRAANGVADVQALHGRLAWLERDGRQALVFLVGLDRRGRFGGPVRLVAGRRVPRIDEIVVDRVLAHDLRVAIGDRLRIGDVSLRVAGIADGGNAVIGSYAFASLGTLRAGGVTAPSLLFARVADGADPAAVQASLAALPGLRVVSRGAFLGQNQALARQLLLPLIAILATVAGVVGGAIVSLVLHTAVVEQRVDWGLLSAVGVSSGQLYRTVVLQAGIATALGVAAGVIASRALALAIPAIEPRFVAVMPLWLVACVAVVAGAIAVLAALAPVRAVAAVDPAVVFRA